MCVRYCEDITDQQWSLDNWIVPTTSTTDTTTSSVTQTSTATVNTPPCISPPVVRCSTHLCKPVERFGPFISSLSGGECGNLTFGLP